MKIYTKRGDDGTTGLYGGKRVSKNSIRVQSYGEIDELNSYIGLLRSYGSLKNIDEQLKIIQNLLFTIGAELATPSDKMYSPNGKSKISCLLSEEKIILLEQWIDEISKTLPPLKQFILPAGNVSSSTAHVARTVCRRSERTIVTLGEIEDIRPIIQKFINRLSDYLFVLARYFAHLSNEIEEPWNPNE